VVPFEEVEHLHERGDSKQATGFQASPRFNSIRFASMLQVPRVGGAPSGSKLHHDNGLVFGSRGYRALVQDYGLTQEYIAPYTAEQNGLCERFIRTFKEECCWIQRFASMAEARR
jgi:putative transposase